MNVTALGRAMGTWVGAIGLALWLAGCQPMATHMPPPPPPPPPVAPPPQVARPLLYVGVNRLNLRAGPGMDFPKVSILERNEEVEKIDGIEDWVRIRVKRDGRDGWVSSRYLSAQPVPTGPEAGPKAPVGVTPPPLPEKIQPPPLPEKPPEKPPAAEKPKPAKPPEAVTPPAKKKPEETKPAKPVKPPKTEEEVEAAPRKPAPEKPAPKEEKPAPAREKPAPVEKPAPPEKPAPKQPEPAPEPSKRIRIM